MINTDSKKVQLNQIVKSQLPSFVSEENPIFVDFLKQYYLSQEISGGSIDIISNLNDYQKVETFSGNDNLIGFTTCTSNVKSYDSTIHVVSTTGWPKEYGLLKIDSEIITYTGITTNSFTGCIRGFSGVENLHKSGQPESLVFNQTESQSHISSSRVINLSNLFLQEIWKKTKNQFLPGFEDRELSTKIDKANFLRQSKDFYSSKGTDEAVKILFGVLFGKQSEVIKPIDYIIRPSDADYVSTYDIVVELISGNPTKVIGQTLFQTDNTGTSASIFNVQKSERNNKEYYLISLSKNSISGNFEVTSSSTLVEGVSIGSSTLNVDSTFGFPESGSLYVGAGQTVGIATYTNKNSTQFFGVSGIKSSYSDGEFIRSSKTVYSFEDGDISKPVFFRLTSVVSNADIDNVGFLSINDAIGAKSLGNISSPVNYRLNTWIHNIKTKSEVDRDINANTSNIDIINNNITTITPHLLYLEDSVTLIDISSAIPENVDGTVNQIISPTQFKISISSGVLQTSKQYIVRRNLSFASSNSSDINVSDFIADIQNTYTDIENNNVYVTSGSLPSFTIYATNRKKTFISDDILNETNININNHGFNSGDLVKYSPVSIGSSSIIGLSTNTVYAVKKVDDNTIALAQNEFDVYSNRLISLVGSGTTHQLIPNDISGKNLVHQNFLRQFPTTPRAKNSNKIIENENIGMFINGVEIHSNRSGDSVYYGTIRNVDVENGGSGYDVINPPNINITDTVGSGATAFAVVENGSFESIEVVSGGYDLKKVPTISITGGNGSGAKASARLRGVRTSRSFNADIDVNTTDNQIIFESNHLFYNGESVVYEKSDQYNPVGGLVDKSLYYVHKISDTVIQLMNTYIDSISGSNPINLTSKSSGTNTLTSTIFRNVLDSVVITDPGSGYSNRKVEIESTEYPTADYTTRNDIRSGINTSNNYFFFKKHGFNTGDLVEYKYSETQVSGLSTSENYYVYKVDDDKFKVISAGIGSTSTSLNLERLNFINIKSKGSGTHTFKYPDISIQVESISGLANTSISSPTLRPICTGNITDVHLTSVGSGYGVNNTFNVHRRPNVTISNGNGAVINVVIDDGKITQAFVRISGGGYSTPPILEVIGDGKYAKLIANLTDDKVTSVSVVDSGTGYTQENTSVRVISVGNGAKLRADVQKWDVDFVQKYKRTFNENDDGIIIPSQNTDYENKYVNVYLPRKLRRIVDDNIENDFSEKSIVSHSPIVGWAYDGSPIYGPYGFDTQTGGPVKRLRPSYTLTTKGNRPPTSIFPLGFFINDWDYTNDGDLDEYNGRFCKTPEFPDGIYAYFCTISEVDSSEIPFTNTREPLFPYVLNGFKFEKNQFNEQPLSLQNLPILNSGNLVRNTFPYKFGYSNSSYDYLITNNLEEVEVNIRSINKTGISTVDVIIPGESYKVNDRIVFNNTNSGGSNASAKVKTLVGKGISELTYEEIIVPNISFVYKNESVTGIATTSHNLKNNDLVIISGIGTGDLKFIEGPRTISVSSVTSKLDVGIGTSGSTGITTDIVLETSADVNNLFVDDVLYVNSEKLTILSIDKINNKYRVRRQSGIITSHESGDIVSLDPSKFSFSVGVQTNLVTKPNRKLVFNPQNSIGIGTTTVVQSVVGVGTTTLIRVISNDETILSDHQLPPPGSSSDNSISIENHGLFTGDRLIYSSGPTGIALSVSNSLNLTNPFSLVEGQTVFAVKKSNNLIGITTTQIGIGSTSTSLYFLPVASYNGTEQSFKTTNKEYVGSIKKYEVTTKVVQDHTLNTGDNVNVHITPNGLISKSLEYDLVARKLIIDPKYFDSSSVGVGTSLSTIEIPNHEFSSGDKVLYSSSTPIVPLINKGEYYVQKLTDSEFKLCETYFDSIKYGGRFIGITSVTGSTVHKISKINPKINATRGKTVGFAVSDFTLQSLKLEFFLDQDFENRYEGFGIDDEIIRSGTPGVPGATVNLTLTDNVPSPLYYKVTPIDLDVIDVSVRDSQPDETVFDGSKIVIDISGFSGRHGITTTSPTEFKYQVKEKPESSLYSTTSGITSFSYTTNSLNALGGINEILVTFPGQNYLKNPGISTIISDFGRNSISRLYNQDIGRPHFTEITKIGYDFPSDKSLKPTVNVPTIVTVTNNYTLSEVGIVTSGRNYISPPDLIVPDDPEINLRANLEGTSIASVDVLTIGRGFNEVPNPPRIIPVRNSNGVGVVTASSNGDTNFLTIIQPTNGWRDDGSDFPFEVGDEIFVEGIDLTSPIESTGGYNSSDYDYSFFTVSSRNPSISQITYSIAGIGTTGGNYNPDTSVGRVIKQSDLPTFSARLTPESYFPGERVTYSSNGEGFVVDNDGYDPVTNTLRLKSLNSNILIGDVIKGFLSGAEGTVTNVISFDRFFDTDYRTERSKGWQRETGKLNNDFQRIEDNDYYQNFSYSIKSEVQEREWDDAVESIIHPSGYKKFADLIVSSQSEVGISRSENLKPSSIDSVATLSVNVDNYKSFYVKDDFDYASEETLSNGFSRYINLQNKKITNFINIKSNVVNTIDDISNQFTGIGTTTSASIVGLSSFKLYDGGIPLFTKVFDGSDSNIISIGSSVIRINNHNFQNGERIKYDPGNEIYGNNRIGIVTTNNVIGGVSTNFLPSDLYVIKIDNNRISLAGIDTAVTLNKPVTFRSVGTGSSHSFDTVNPNNRVIITIDGIIQSPLYKKNVDVELSEPIGIGSTTIKVVGVTSISTNDLLNIDNEIIKLNVVGFGSTNIITVDRGFFGSVASAHTVGAAVTVKDGDFNIIKDVIYFSNPPYGLTGISTLQPGISTQSSFSGRVFNRQDTSTNFIFDDLSDKFTGIGKTFTLLQNNEDVTGIVTTKVGDGGSDEVVNNGIILINNIFQRPTIDYTLEERLNPGIGASIFFSGSSEYDLPRGGKVNDVSVGFGSGYQNLVAAAATANVNPSGSIESVVVTGGGSGYRSGPISVQVFNPLGVGSTAILEATVGAAGTITGISTVSGGSGYSSSNPPIIVVGIPTAYSNMSFTGGNGSGLKATVIVGTGGSIVDYNITDTGIGYVNGDVLTVAGIPTDPTAGIAFSSFTFTVNSIISDKFSGYSFGQLLPLDSFEDQFNGSRKVFTLSRTVASTEIININSEDTSVNVANNLLIFLNDVLQQPGENYVFNGGTTIEFTEAPKSGSKLQVLFYRGSNTDVDSGSSLQTVKVGDRLTLQKNGTTLSQSPRRVSAITGVSQVETNIYAGLGINTNTSFTRMISWEKQTSDLILNNQPLSKSRSIFSSKIQPTTRIIRNVGINSDEIYVENAFPLFSAFDNRTNINSIPGVGINLIRENNVNAADGVATVSVGGTISTVTVTDFGGGYESIPTVSFASSVPQIDEIGKSWISSNSNTDIEYNNITYSDFGVFIAVGSTSGINTSTDGVIWYDSPISGFSTFKDVVGLTTNVVIVGLGGSIAVSVDRGGSYQSSTIYRRQRSQFLTNYFETSISQDLNSIAYTNDTLVVVGSAGTILFSKSGSSGFGTSFIITDKFGSENLHGVSNNSSTFIAVGDNGQILRSNNGEVWSGVSTSSVTTKLNDVYHENDTWIAVGAAGSIIRSTDDGLNWSVVSSGSTFDLNSVYYQNNVWVAIGQSGNVLNSVDTNNWYQKFTGINTDFNGLYFGNNKLIAVGLSSSIVYSQFETVSAAATATVSAGGTITEIIVNDGGFGYNPDFGVEVLVSIEPVTIETIVSVECEGDYGVLVGVGTSATGIGTNTPMVKFELDSDNFLDQAGFGNISRSGINVGDYFVINGSVVGNGLTSINNDGSVIGFGTTFIDNVYKVEEVITSNSGIVTVHSNVQSLAGLGTTSISPKIGNYSWGRFYNFQRDRVNPKSFSVNNENGYTGIQTAPLVMRILPLVENYSNFDQTS